MSYGVLWGINMSFGVFIIAYVRAIRPQGYPSVYTLHSLAYSLQVEQQNMADVKTRIQDNTKSSIEKSLETPKESRHQHGRCDNKFG